MSTNGGELQAPDSDNIPRDTDSGSGSGSGSDSDSDSDTDDDDRVPKGAADAIQDAEKQLPEELETPTDIYVQVEAFGSGVLLHEGFAVPLDETVADLRQRIKSDLCTARTRTVRLFVGHGGKELDDDDVHVAESLLAVAVDEPLVIFRIMCKSLYAMCLLGDQPN